MLIDIHVHTAVGPGPFRANGETYATPEELIAKYDPAGIRLGVLLPSASPECCFRLTSTEQALEICRRYPDRFVTFCNIDPRYLSNSPEADFTPHLEFYREQGCKGVGEVTANLHFDDPRVENLFHHCEKCRLPLVFHIATRQGGTYGLIDDLGLPRLEKELAQFPELIFLGHSQPFWSEISGDVTEENRGGYPPGKVAPGGRVPELLEKYPHLRGDLSAGSGYNAVSRDPEFGYAFLERFQDQLLFGTDICAPSNQTPLVDFLREAAEEGHISREAYEKIGWKNALELLNLE